MVSASAAMSGPSMRRDRISKTRLITLLVLDDQRLLHHGLLLEEIEVEHLARDGRGGRAAVAAVLHQDRHGELRIVRGSEGDEQRVVAVLLLDLLLVVALALL